MAPKEKQPGSRMTNTITIHMHLDPLLCPVTVYTIYVSCLALDRIFKHIRRIMIHVSKPHAALVPKSRTLGVTLVTQVGISVISSMTSNNLTMALLDQQPRSQSSKYHQRYI
ncbi:hypothetical protein AB4K20DRAFT_1949997 [Rhizopus microsporus]|uniref:Uncharacterized protein n=1 Tax=Rhizopus microsporus TaxID=58291 RepID=A0A1X0SFW5_RHIZD|nr:hypothetical protein BCV71DRAFT_287678 [Rhizopus microsporus]